MAFCSKCGAEIDEGAKFCPNCGEATGSNKTDGSAKNETGKGTENEFEKIINTPDTTESFDRDDIAKNKGMAVLSYIWILFIIPLFAAKDSKFARFHANQGLVLFIVDTCVAVCARLARSIFAGIPILWGRHVHRFLSCLCRMLCTCYRRYHQCRSGQGKGTAPYRQHKDCEINFALIYVADA